MTGANRRAEELATADDAVLASQFENDTNPRAHRRTTGPEIRRDTDGDVDAVVAGVGTGGTITGVAEYFETRDAEVRLVAVEPESSPTISAQSSDGHDIQGIGPGFVPGMSRTELLDEVRAMTAEDARETARRLGCEAGACRHLLWGSARRSRSVRHSQSRRDDGGHPPGHGRAISVYRPVHGRGMR